MRGAVPHLPNQGRRQHLLAPVLACLLWCCLALVPAGASAEPAPFKVTKDVRYMKRIGQKGTNLLDIYTPRHGNDERRPVLVWIHSGGWYKGNKTDQTRAKAISFVKAGFVVVAVNYRLSPKLTSHQALSSGRVMFPDAVEDVASGLGWIDKNITDYGGDPEKMILCGHSAGGQIAALLATDPIYGLEARVFPAQIKGVISLDAVGLNLSSEAGAGRDDPAADFQRMYWNAFGTPAENRKKGLWDEATPMNHAVRTDPPTLFITSTEAPWREADARKMSKKLGLSDGFSVVPVGKSHKQINVSFGRSSDTTDETVQGMRFAHSLVADRPGRPVIKGHDRYGIASYEKSTVARFRVSTEPSKAVLRCRLDGERSHFCSGTERYRVGRGRHVLRVFSYDFAKKRIRREAHPFTVSG